MIRLEMNKKQEAILAAIIVGVAVGAFLLFSRVLEPQPAPEPAPPPPPSLVDTVTAQKHQHDEIYSGLLLKLESGTYTPSSPLLAVDPFGSSPLTALLLFKTEEPAQISVHVHGKTANTSISHTFEGYGTSHVIPILGLYSDMVNLIEVSAQTDAGLKQSTMLRIETEGLPEELSAEIAVHSVRQDSIAGLPLYEIETYPFDEARVFEVARALEELGERDTRLYFTHVIMSAFDSGGNYRWFYDDFGIEYPTRYTDGGNMLIITGSFEDNDALQLEVDMLGRIIDFWPVTAVDIWPDNPGFESGFYSAHHVERRALYTGIDN